ncbi:MAG: mannose-phosphate guanylyltransferase [Frankiales bacterium]|nr:mannose-phosphate guanylyltransferase [Frankiales bacterium]
MTELCGVALAAGSGARLRPLSLELPKALCPVGGVPLVDLALERLVSLGIGSLAVNTHSFAETMAAHVDGRAHVSVESGQALGTAGALGQLRPWIAGRATVVTNADAYLLGPVSPVLDGWNGSSIRLGVVHDEDAPDFGGRWRYAGICVMPWAEVCLLEPVPSGLYEVSWRAGLAAGRVELVPLPGPFVDCGTPSDYLAANMLASGGSTVMGEGAAVEGSAVRCVLWPGARVAEDEHLVDAIRTATGLTVQG